MSRLARSPATLADAPPVRPSWPAQAAAAWALLFAAQSLAAAIIATAGSTWGADTFGRDIARSVAQQDPGFIALLWVAAIAKALGGGLALAPVSRWRQRVPRRPVVLVTYVVGALVLIYGVGNLVEHALMDAGAITIPSGLGAHALPWHLWLWDPYWILGGLLFLAAGRAVARTRA